MQCIDPLWPDCLNDLGPRPMAVWVLIPTTWTLQTVDFGVYLSWWSVLKLDWSCIGSTITVAVWKKPFRILKIPWTKWTLAGGKRLQNQSHFLLFKTPADNPKLWSSVQGCDRNKKTKSIKTRRFCDLILTQLGECRESESNRCATIEASTIAFDVWVI